MSSLSNTMDEKSHNYRASPHPKCNCCTKHGAIVKGDMDQHFDLVAFELKYDQIP